MSRLFLAFLALAVSAPAYAGGLSNPPPAGAVDTSNLATKSEVQAAQAKADAAATPATVTSAVAAATSSMVTQSALDAVAAAIPSPASTIPTMETVGGAAGTGNTFRRGDAVQPRITRSVAFTTGAAGTVAVTWAALSSVPLVFPMPNIASTSATQGPMCYPVTGTITTTGATIKCFTTQSVTVSILGAVVAPIIAAGAGVTGQVLAIPVS